MKARFLKPGLITHNFSTSALSPSSITVTQYYPKPEFSRLVRVLLLVFRELASSFAGKQARQNEEDIEAKNLAGFFARGNFFAAFPWNVYLGWRQQCESIGRLNRIWIKGAYRRHSIGAQQFFCQKAKNVLPPSSTYFAVRGLRLKQG